MTVGDLIHHPDFETWYKYFLEQERRAWEAGWKHGYDAGRHDYFQAREEEWAELFIRDPWWIDKLQRPTYMEMEERRYGPLPADFTEPEYEENPGEARRRARAANREETLWVSWSPAESAAAQRLASMTWKPRFAIELSTGMRLSSVSPRKWTGCSSPSSKKGLSMPCSASQA